MRNFGFWQVPHFPARAKRAGAKVYVLVPEPVGLIKKSDLLKKFASYQHACAGDLLHARGLGGIPIPGELAPPQPIARPYAIQPEKIRCQRGECGKGNGVISVLGGPIMIDQMA